MVAADRRVLVTGATGFIGGHLVRRLLADGCDVACLVRAPAGGEALRAAGTRLFVGDVTDRAAVAHAVSSSDARVVFHLAGAVRALAAADFMRANEGGVEAVAKACAGLRVRPVLVLVSSLAAAGPSRGRTAVESDAPAPVSDYGRSKLAGERIAMNHAASMPITVVRPGIVFGAGDRGMLEVFRPVARSGVHVVPGAGDGRLALVAVTDLVDCLVLAAERGERLAPGVSGAGIYFAAAGDMSHVELGAAIAHAMGKPLPRSLHLPAWSLRTVGRCGDIVSALRRRPGWVGRDKVREVLAGTWTCSAAKAREQLGWMPAATLADRLHETAQWYRAAGWL